MAEETVSKRGRPVGTRTATVELDTLSFKVPAELKARLQAYAKQRRHSISELIRDGVEWRISEESDPRSWQPGAETSSETAYEGNTGNIDKVGSGIEFFHGMLSALVDEVRQLRNSVQALEQRIEDTRSLHAPSVVQDAMVPRVNIDKEEVLVRIQQMRDEGLDSAQITKELQAEGVPTLSAEAQLQAVVEILEHREVQGSSEGITSITSAEGDIPVASMKAQSTARQTRAAEGTREGMPSYDPAKHHLGKLCPRSHEWGSTGQSLRNADNQCLKCKAEDKREKRQAKRQQVSA